MMKNIMHVVDKGWYQFHFSARVLLGAWPSPQPRPRTRSNREPRPTHTTRNTRE